MAPWNKTTAPVLRRVRKLTLPILEGQLNEPDIACANKVWAHLGVEMARYDEKDNWNFVEKALRPQVRKKLEAIFDEAAFFVDGRVANPARDKFKKADLLAWGACLLADAAANAAVADAEFEEALRLLAVVEPEGDEAVDAAAGNAATGAAVADRVAVAAASSSGTAVESAEDRERDSREESTDGRLRWRPDVLDKSKVSLDDVEPAEDIVKRFATGLMSLGSISRESHEALDVRRVAELLARRSDTQGYERNEVDRELAGVVSALWGSDELRRAKPSPQQEARGGLAVVETSLLKIGDAMLVGGDDVADHTTDEVKAMEYHSSIASSVVDEPGADAASATETASSVSLPPRAESSVDKSRSDRSQYWGSVSSSTLRALRKDSKEGLLREAKRVYGPCFKGPTRRWRSREAVREYERHYEALRSPCADSDPDAHMANALKAKVNELRLNEKRADYQAAFEATRRGLFEYAIDGVWCMQNFTRVDGVYCVSPEQEDVLYG